MEKLTKQQAIQLYESGFWKDLSDKERVRFQLFEPLLCMPFEVFHKSTEECLGRPVFTHEFGLNLEGLQAEFLGDATKPSFQDILNLIPEDKRVVIIVGKEG